MAKGNDIDLENISMKKWKCEKKRVNKRKTKIIMGEYYVSAENLAENVQVGDIVTIWFNGMIQETYPAQLGVVYRIIKTQ